MAITLQQQPPTFTPVYNPVIFLALSDNTAQIGFQYVFDVYWDGVLQTRHRIPARPDTGQAVFDAGRIVEAQMTDDIDITTMGFATCPNSYKKFQVKIGEEYEVAGVTTLFADLATSNQIYAFNGIFDPLDFPDYSATTYMLNASSSTKLMTNQPASVKIQLLQLAWIGYITNSPTNIASMKVKTYDSAGTIINTGTQAATGFNTNTDDNRNIRVGCGPVNLLSMFGSTFLDGATYYTVQIFNSVPSAISELKTFVLQCPSPKNDTVRLHFLNKLGRYDAFNFIMNSEKDSTINRKTYQRTTGLLSGSTYTFPKSQRAEHVLNTTINDNLTINSDWITEEESTWLKELVTSPCVLIETSTALIPITIQETSYREQKKDNEKVFNLKIRFNYSQQLARQRY